MRIGIDCRKFYDAHLNKGAGVERYTYHLVKKILSMDQDNDYVLFFYSDISPETIHKIRSQNSRVKIVKLFRTSSRIPLFDNHFRFSQLLKKEKLDTTIFPANVIPFFYNRKSILVVHDLAIYLHPEWFPEKQWFSIKFLVPHSIKKANQIIAISENTKSDLLKVFNLKNKKVDVIYPGVVVKDSYLDEEVIKVREKYKIEDNYILFVGTIEPRKNIYNLIKAFSNYLFENEESKLNLVIAGIKGWKFQPIFHFLNDVNKRLKNPQIKYIGKISNRERNILIKSAQAFVFPSKYEGFGFPVLESMALNTPVITGDNSSLREVSGGASILINAEEPNEIRRAIKRVIDDKELRFQLIKKGKEQVKKFTWERTAKEFLRKI